MHETMHTSTGGTGGGTSSPAGCGTNTKKVHYVRIYKSKKWQHWRPKWRTQNVRCIPIKKDIICSYSKIQRE